MFSDIVVLSTIDTTTTQRTFPFNTLAEPITNTISEARESSLDWYTYLKNIALSNGMFMPHLSEAFLTMLASENILRRDWDQPDEDEAWADL